ncbi:MAG: hypothetical protein J5614_07510, partial [Paludibacteraceae bacterium]|nr:hypothetical protein [Paludibacteraceae bacterium]
AENEKLLKMVWQLTVKVFFCRSLRKSQTEEEIRGPNRQRPAGISRKRFCSLMKPNRSTLYYKRKGESETNVEIMNKMNAIYTEHSTSYGKH